LLSPNTWRTRSIKMLP